MSFGTVVIRSNRLPTLGREFRGNVERIIAAHALQCEAIAKTHAPVDTGALRNSIQAQPVNSLEWEVGPAVDYGLFVEMGTVKMAPQPYMTPAAEAVRGPFIDAMRGAVDV